MNRNTWKSYVRLALIVFLVGGCNAQSPVIVNTTRDATSIQEGTDAPSAPTRTPPSTAQIDTIVSTSTATPADLVICLGSSPDNLYVYGDKSLAQIHILEAIYDGPIDNNSYGHQAVILEKLPSLADGDATIQPVPVQEGELFVDNEGELNYLSAGDLIRPAGCQSSGCAVTHPGGAAEMDQLSVTFTLLEDLKWSDGAPLTAHDSVYSFNLYADPLTPTDKFIVERTASYEADDEQTTRWVGLPGFLDQTYYLNFWQPLPEHIWGEFSARELLDGEVSTIIPIGWGPYMIAESEEGKQVTLSRNPYYFRSDEGFPKYDRLIFRFLFETPETNLDALLTRECDVLDQEASFLFARDEDLLNLAAEKKVNAIYSPGTLFEQLVFALQPSPDWHGFSATGAFQDVRLRQAVALCLDRQRVVDELFFGRSVVLNSYVPPGHPLYSPDLPFYGFDAQAGAALLDQAGWVDDDEDPSTPRVYDGEVERIPLGTALEFSYWTTEDGARPKTAELFAASLLECGIKINVQFWEPGAFFAEDRDGPVFGRNFDMVQLTFRSGERPPCDFWLADNIPGDPALIGEDGTPVYPLGWSGTNTSGYINPEFEQACRTAIAFLPGQPGYADFHLNAQEILSRDLPAIPLFPRLKLAISRPDLCGLIMDSTTDSELWNIEEFNFGADCP